MTFQIDDTIVALSSAAGLGGRAIVRLSGPRALEITRAIFRGPINRDSRGISSGHLVLSDVASPLPADMYHFPAPHSVTGQSVVELHLISSPPLVELLIAELLRHGARAAGPGEFSLRGFLAGKLDLPRAEAVVGVIEAGSRGELKQSLRQLAGGVSRPLAGLREDMLNLLADLEAGLDFVDEDIEFVNQPELLQRIANGLAQVSLVQKQVQDRGLADRTFRIALVGAPNAGKSTLFNALTGQSALVSSIPGTTRDYLTAKIDIDDITAELIDTAGRRETTDLIESRAQTIIQEELSQIDLVILCVEPDSQSSNLHDYSGDILAVSTKCDIREAPKGVIATSGVTGTGLIELRQELKTRAMAFAGRGLAPSLSRCRHHVDACLGNLRAAHRGVLFSDPAEIVAIELRLAVEHLGAMTGAVYTDDLLDRIFSRFCIGK